MRLETLKVFLVQSTPFIADTVGTSSWCPHYRESVIAGYYFSQTSVIYFCPGFSCGPYYRGVRSSGVSATRELTVLCCKGLHELLKNAAIDESG